MYRNRRDKHFIMTYIARTFEIPSSLKCLCRHRGVDEVTKGKWQPGNNHGLYLIQFTLIGVSALIFVQPPLQPLMFELQTLDTPCLCSYCFDKPDPSHIYSIYTDVSPYPFNCTRNSPHRHLTKCRSYRLENLWIQISLFRRCPDFLVFFGINYSRC